MTAQLSGVLNDIDGDWSGWNSTQRDEACWALQDPYCGPDAWDVVELHNNAWIYQDYRPACASAGGNPRCGSSVQVGTGCHNAGSVNYVIFGRMCSLCDIWKVTMHLMIWAHKVHLSGMDQDYPGALAWAGAGFAGWTPGSSPSGDRNNCLPACPTPYRPTANNSSARFKYHWYPTHQRETVGASCPRMLELERHPPEPLPGDFGL